MVFQKNIWTKETGNKRSWRKSRMRLAGHDKCMQMFWPENVNGRNHLGIPGIDGNIILNFNKLYLRVRTGFNWLKTKSNGGRL